MAAVTPIISTLGTIGSVVGGVVSARDTAKQAKKQSQREQAAIANSAKAETADRNRATRRAAARKRALFSAQGISTEGSGEAILLGLFEENEDELQRREELDRLRVSALKGRESSATQRSLIDGFSSLSSLGGGNNRFL